ncbi:DUF3619 family protein [Azonexus sp.]|uniref:DUF3619 family protein n=1 Tax=Azonexus sp. TaxID=1872668 RepID=UPI0027B920A0|nr:DUF3619 family protein [Azonexus sp.]
MNEERQAYRIRQLLNYGLQDISRTSIRRMEAARHMALSRQKAPTAILSIAGFGSMETQIISRGSNGKQNSGFKQILAICALLFGMWLSFNWHSDQYVAEVEAVDSALLTDDLPPDVFLDTEFLEWLKDDTSEE